MVYIYLTTTQQTWAAEKKDFIKKQKKQYKPFIAKKAKHRERKTKSSRSIFTWPGSNKVPTLDKCPVDKTPPSKYASVLPEKLCKQIYVSKETYKNNGPLATKPGG